MRGALLIVCICGFSVTVLDSANAQGEGSSSARPGVPWKPKPKPKPPTIQTIKYRCVDWRVCWFVDAGEAVELSDRLARHGFDVEGVYVVHYRLPAWRSRVFTGPHAHQSAFTLQVRFASLGCEVQRGSSWTVPSAKKRQ